MIFRRDFFKAAACLVAGLFFGKPPEEEECQVGEAPKSFYKNIQMGFCVNTDAREMVFEDCCLYGTPTALVGCIFKRCQIYVSDVKLVEGCIFKDCKRGESDLRLADGAIVQDNIFDHAYLTPIGGYILK